MVRKGRLAGILLLFSSVSFADSYLSDYSRLNGIAFFLDPVRDFVLLTFDRHEIRGRVGDPILLSNEWNQWVLDNPLHYEKGEVVLTKAAEGVISSYFFGKNTGDDAFKIVGIVIDPGHGGIDPGAVRTYTIDGKETVVKEKEIVLKVSDDVAAMLKDKYPHRRVIQTRDDDRAIELGDRPEIANKLINKANELVIFISIHVNAAFNTDATGFEIWHIPAGYERDLIKGQEWIPDNQVLKPIFNQMLEDTTYVESRLLSLKISQELLNAIGAESPFRGILEKEWYVVREARMPSALVEIGYLSNRDEAIRLLDDTYLKKVAQGIYNGIVLFIDEFERTNGFSE